MFTINKCF